MKITLGKLIHIKPGTVERATPLDDDIFNHLDDERRVQEFISQVNGARRK